MTASFPTYDLMLLLSTDVEEERRNEIVETTEALIAEKEGQVVGSYDWGVRQLTFEIGDRPDAHYRLIQFTGPPALLEALDHMLKIADGVARFRVIKILPGTPPVPEIAEDEPPVVEAEAVEAA